MVLGGLFGFLAFYLGLECLWFGVTCGVVVSYRFHMIFTCYLGAWRFGDWDLGLGV